MFDHKDTLEELNKNLPLGEKLSSVHSAIQKQFSFIDRIAVAIYDHKTDMLKTYIHSSGNEQPLNHYQSPLAESPSLMEIIKQGKPRVVNDLAIFAEGTLEHTEKIKKQGYASSYTLPMFVNDVFFGFVFFNSNKKDVFCALCLGSLSLSNFRLVPIWVSPLAKIGKYFTYAKKIEENSDYKIISRKVGENSDYLVISTHKIPGFGKRLNPDPRERPREPK